MARLGERETPPITSAPVASSDQSEPSIQQQDVPATAAHLGSGIAVASQADLVCIWPLIHRDLRAFFPEISRGFRNMMDTFVPVRVCTMLGISAALVHNAVLCVMHLLWRAHVDWTYIGCLLLSLIICFPILCVLWTWETVKRRHKEIFCKLSSIGYLLCIALNLVVNALPGRTSAMALFDAVLLSAGSLVTNRKIHPDGSSSWYVALVSRSTASLSLSACVSWLVRVNTGFVRSFTSGRKAPRLHLPTYLHARACARAHTHTA